MKIIKKKAKKRSSGNPASKYSPKKERVLNELCENIGDAGYTVRREKLKQGANWKVMSGSCEFQGDELIFVDRRMSQDDQIAFLVSKMISLGLEYDESMIQKS